ncbi:MAG: hypothetical protein LBT59_25880 [Clostridiales bacterium]|jgi:hypothetical protein|nr:hypothetical protein [Clostridiales bacterium]
MDLLDFIFLLICIIPISPFLIAMFFLLRRNVKAARGWGTLQIMVIFYMCLYAIEVPYSVLTDLFPQLNIPEGPYYYFMLFLFAVLFLFCMLLLYKPYTKKKRLAIIKTLAASVSIAMAIAACASVKENRVTVVTTDIKCISQNYIRGAEKIRR